MRVVLVIHPRDIVYALLFLSFLLAMIALWLSNKKPPH